MREKLLLSDAQVSNNCVSRLRWGASSTFVVVRLIGFQPSTSMTIPDHVNKTTALTDSKSDDVLRIAGDQAPSVVNVHPRKSKPANSNRKRRIQHVMRACV
jgi:hypothetical protein